MLKKFFSWLRSLFRKSFKDSLEGFVPKSAAQRGSDTKPIAPLVIPRAKKPCGHCGEPMFLSIGQIAFTHRLCRTKWRLHNRSRYAY